MQSNDKKNLIRWGIIGCGNVTEVKSGPAYQQTDGFELAAVMRRDEAKAQDYAKRHGVPKVFSDAEALIGDPEVDAVYIATPPDSHQEYALRVAAAGKPCCIEKPMAPTHKECLAICAAFNARNIPLFVAYYRRTLPRFTQVKAWLDDGLIGDVRHVSWQFSKPPSAQDLSGGTNWRTDTRIAAGGYFDDLASHGLDLLAFYLGDFKEVAGFGINQQSLYSAKDALAASWIHESGVTGTGSWNFGSALRQDRVEILGSKGQIEFAVFEDLPIRLTTENGTEALTVEHPRHVQHYHVEALRNALLKNGSHPSSGKTAAHTAWVMDKILGRI
jgi:1,5-anhydro-D-fructose reductase (1,5-anhydro-D-mannitol-forming)